MPLQIAARENGPVAILDLRGALILGDECTIFRDHIKELVDAGKTRILLNLEKLTFLDSTGMGALVSCYTSVRAKGGNLKLTNLSDRLRHTLQVTRLLTIFEAYNTEAEGVASFS